MGYDAWRTESDRDHEERVGTHYRGEPVTYPQAGVCACGMETTRAVSQRHGFIWQCKTCAESALRAIYDRAARSVRA